MKYLWLILFVLIISPLNHLKAQEIEKVVEKWDNGVIKTKHYYNGTGFDEELAGIKKY